MRDQTKYHDCDGGTSRLWEGYFKEDKHAAAIAPLPSVQMTPGGGTVLDSDVMATINRDIDQRFGLPNSWTGADRRKK